MFHIYLSYGVCSHLHSFVCWGCNFTWGSTMDVQFFHISLTKLWKCFEKTHFMQYLKKGKYETSGFLCNTLYKKDDPDWHKLAHPDLSILNIAMHKHFLLSKEIYNCTMTLISVSKLSWYNIVPAYHGHANSISTCTSKLPIKCIRMSASARVRERETENQRNFNSMKARDNWI